MGNANSHSNTAYLGKRDVMDTWLENRIAYVDALLLNGTI